MAATISSRLRRPLLLALCVVFSAGETRLHAATPTTAAEPFEKIHIYNDRTKAVTVPSTITDHVNISNYDASLNSTNYKVLVDSMPTALFHSFAYDATNLRIQNSGDSAKVEYTLSPPRYATHVGLLLMAFNVFNGTGGFADLGKTAATVTVTFEDNSTYIETFTVGNRLRSHRTGQNCLTPGPQPLYTGNPTNALWSNVWSGGGFFYDLNQIRLPADKRRFKVTKVGIEGSRIAHNCDSINIYGGVRVHGISVWSKFLVGNSSNFTVGPHYQCQSDWNTVPYGGYRYGNAVYGTHGKICSMGCALSCISSLHEFFGVASTPETLNDWLQRNRGFMPTEFVEVTAIPGGLDEGDEVQVRDIGRSPLEAGFEVLIDRVPYADPIATLLPLARTPSDPPGHRMAIITRLFGSTHTITVGSKGRLYRKVSWVKAAQGRSSGAWRIEENDLGGSNLAEAVEAELVAGRPVLLNVDNYHHWVVARGMEPDDRGNLSPGTYSIADVGYAQPSSSGKLPEQLTFDGWRATGAAGANLFSRAKQCIGAAAPAPGLEGPDSPAVTAGSIVITVEGAAAADVEDPSGKKIEYDPGQDTYTSDIPGSLIDHNWFFEDLDTGELESGPFEIMEIPEALDGTYDVTVRGSTGDEFNLQIADYDDDGTCNTATAEGLIGPGGQSRYQVAYSSVPGTAPIITNITTSVPEAPGLPEPPLSLAMAPNPFRDSCRLTFRIESAGHVSLTVYDAQGRLITSLVEMHRSAGDHAFVWDGRDSSGRPAPKGVYFVHLKAGDQSLTRSLVIAR